VLPRYSTDERRMVAIHGALVDATFDAYLEWRERSAAAQEAYAGWRDALKADRALAFAAYTAALDREERASVAYADLASRAGRVLNGRSHTRRVPAAGYQ
jgi:hypothetical protein